MITWAIIFALGRLGFTAAEASVLAPQIILLAKTAYSVYVALKSTGIGSGAALARVGKMIGAPHKMTTDEEKLWMDRASDVGAGG